MTTLNWLKVPVSLDWLLGARFRQATLANLAPFTCARRF